MNMARMGYSEATALNDPRTELVILGLSENAAVTTCGWARHFFDSGGPSGVYTHYPLKCGLERPRYRSQQPKTVQDCTVFCPVAKHDDC
jgi:hypothetical protein